MANRYMLHLRFDADQVTKALNYEITGVGANPKSTPYKTEGPCAGTYNFKVGDILEVMVTATAKKDDKARFTVTNFTLASIPMLDPGKYYLSMFDEHRACTDITHWGVPQSNADNTEISVDALHPLSITAPNGQWEISGYLSVLIEKSVEDGTALRIPRLFYFDPEGTTGSGGGGVRD